MDSGGSFLEETVKTGKMIHSSLPSPCCWPTTAHGEEKKSPVNGSLSLTSSNPGAYDSSFCRDEFNAPGSGKVKDCE